MHGSQYNSYYEHEIESVKKDDETSHSATDPQYQSLTQVSWSGVIKSVATPLGVMFVHNRLSPWYKYFARFSHQTAGTHLYPWVERGKPLAKIPCGPFCKEKL